MENRNNDRKTLIINILTVLMFFGLYKIIKVLLVDRVTDSVYNVFATEVAILFCAIMAAIVTKKIKALRLTKKGFFKGVFVGLFVLCLDTFGLVYWIYQYYHGEQAVSTTIVKVIVFVLAMVMVGMSEELFFRGILINAFNDYFGENSVSALRKSIVLSSVLFGLMHYFNMLSGAKFYGTTMQAISAVVLGIVLGTVYIRSGKNIWPCVFLHGYHDFVSFIQGGIFSGTTTSETVSSYDSTKIPGIVLLFILAIFLMRKKKMLPFVHSVSEVE